MAKRHAHSSESRRERLFAAGLVIAAGANAEVVGNVHFGTLGPILGVLFLFGVPTLLVRDLISDAWTDLSRWLLAFAAAICGLEVLGLGVNELLPLVGDPRPLTRLPLLIAVDLAVAALVGALLQKNRKVGRRTYRTVAQPPSSSSWPVLRIAAVVTPLLGAAGAVRLSNNHGDAVSLVALTLACVLCMAILWKSPQLRPTQVALCLCSIGATVLLATAMRSWFVIGPDALSEYANFQLISHAARWSPGGGTSAYNSCMSITILPQMLTQLTGISGVWVWKTILPLIFSACPAFVFAIGERFTGRRTAVLGAIIFLSFPAFVYNLEATGRQEVAFVFVGAAILAIVGHGRPQRLRLFIVAALGMILSHYSTSYAFAALLGLALVVFVSARFVGKIIPPIAWSPSFRTFVLPWTLVLAFVAGVILWEGPVNGVLGDLTQTATASLNGSVAQQAVTGPNGLEERGGVRVDRADVELSAYASLEQYIALKGAPSSSDVISERTLQRYEVRSVDILNGPLSDFGRELARVGVPPGQANRLIRDAIADALVLLVAVGLLLLTFSRTVRRPGLALLGVASAAIVGASDVVPALAVGYGPARTFQQALFVLAPVIAMAVEAVTRMLRVPLRRQLTGLVTFAALLSLSGVIPQVTGGYVSQIDLNNTGAYVADYYATPAEIAAARWVNGALTPSQVQMSPAVALKLITLLHFPVSNSDFPNRLATNSAVLLGTQTVQSDLDVAFEQLIYRYPLGLLETTKSRVYASQGAAIYYGTAVLRGVAPSSPISFVHRALGFPTPEP